MNILLNQRILTIHYILSLSLIFLNFYFSIHLQHNILHLTIIFFLPLWYDSFQFHYSCLLHYYIILNTLRQLHRSPFLIYLYLTRPHHTRLYDSSWLLFNVKSSQGSPGNSLCHFLPFSVQEENITANVFLFLFLLLFLFKLLAGLILT